MAKKNVKQTEGDRVFTTDEIMLELRVQGVWRQVMRDLVGPREMTKNEWIRELRRLKISFDDRP